MERKNLSNSYRHPSGMKERVRDSIACHICYRLDPKIDVLGVHFSRKQLRQLMKSKIFKYYLSVSDVCREGSGIWIRFCDSRTVHHRMFERTFGEEYCEEYKDFMEKIWKSDERKIRRWKDNNREEYKGVSSHVYLYNLYGEVRKWINGTALAIKRGLDDQTCGYYFPKR